MGVNNEGIVNRRQLLVRVGSLMKLSFKKSRDNKLNVNNEDNFNDEDDNDGRLVRRGRGRRVRKNRNLFVQFDDELCEFPSNYGDEPISDDEIEKRWYKSDDYCRFKKDTIINSLNYINARRASKPFDDTQYCIRGIEDMCIVDPTIGRRQTAEKKYVFKVIREEQARQKKELQQKQQEQQQQQQQQDNQNSSSNSSSSSSSTTSFPDMEKFRSASLCYTKAGRDRALARGNEWARAQQRTLGRTSSMKNLFAACRI